MYWIRPFMGSMCVFSRKIRSLGRVSCAGENACRRRTIFIVRSLRLKMKSMRAKRAFSKATANIRTFFNAKGFEEKVLEKFCRSLAARRSCRRRRVKSPAGSSFAAGLVFCPDGRVLGAMRPGPSGRGVLRRRSRRQGYPCVAQKSGCVLCRTKKNRCILGMQRLG